MKNNRGSSGLVVFIAMLVIAVLLIALFSGCTEKIVAPEVENKPDPNVQILIKAGDYSTTSLNEIYVLADKPVIFFAEFTSNIRLHNWHWTFADGGTADGQSASHTYKLQPPAQTSVTVTAFDSLNRSYSTTATVFVVSNFENVASFWPYSITSAGNGKFNIVFAGDLSYDSHVAGMPGPLRQIGDGIDSWSVTQIIPDTNLVFDSNHKLVPAGTGNKGSYFLVKMTLAPDTLVEIGIGKLKNDNPNDMTWAKFPGEYVSKNNPTKIQFRVLSNGSVVPYTTPAPQVTLPGYGLDSLVRVDLVQGKVRVMIRVSNPSPFLKYEDTSGVLSQAKATSPVSGFPEWTGYLISPSEIPEVLSMHFGENISEPLRYSDKEKKSIYYDSDRQKLMMQIRIVSLNKSAGGGIIISKAN